MEGRPSKRHRASSSSPSSSDSDDSSPLNPMEIFRRHFESRFQAIDDPSAVLDPTSSNAINEGSDVEDDGEEWSGISGSEGLESEGNASVEVVHHTSSACPEAPRMSKRKLNAFMVYSLPTLCSHPRQLTYIVLKIAHLCLRSPTHCKITLRQC